MRDAGGILASHRAEVSTTPQRPPSPAPREVPAALHWDGARAAPRPAESHISMVFAALGERVP